jgi:5'-phosphate synthase pdxT subunit
VSAQVGVLALQGDFVQHRCALLSCGVQAVLVTKPHQLDGLAGLVIPGGESSALLRLMSPLGWQAAIKHFHQQGGFVFGTCAGMILLAQSVVPQQASLGLIDITVERNAYGRQRDSHVVSGVCSFEVFGVGAFEMVFIRAPKITQVGDSVQVLAWEGELPVLVRQENVICASFHPELSKKSPIYQLLKAQML